MLYATTTVVLSGAVSNTVIVAATGVDSSITNNLIVAGTNIASYEARTGTTGDNYWNNNI